MENAVTDQRSHRALRTLLAALLALLCWCAASGNAFAAATITSVTINGQTRATVLPGSTIAVRIDVSFTGTTRWRRTQLSTNPTSTLDECREHSDSTDDGNWYYEFTTIAPDTDGVHDLVITIHGSNSCNSAATTGIFTDVLTTDSSFPKVQSIVRIDPSPTNLNAVSWTVTFDRPVTGVTLPDFAAVATGITGTPTLTLTAVSSTVYTVRSTTGGGSGTLGLNLVDNDSILGPNGARLGGTGTGTGTGSGNYTGQVYAIDRSAPTIPTATIIANGVSPVFARVGDIVSISFTTDDVSAVQTPVATIGGLAATVTGSGSSWSARRTMTTADVEGLVAFTLNVKDAFGNAATARTTTTNGSSVTFDKTVPVASISCASPASCGTANPIAAGQVKWAVNFSEAVFGLGATHFTLSGAAATGSSIVSVTGSGSAYTVTVNAVGPGLLGLNLSQNLGTVRDRAGNNPGANTAVPANSYTVGGCSMASGGACTLDAVEVGGVVGSPIFTKRTGADVTLEILALNGTELNNSSVDPVTVTLVAAVNGTCGSDALSNSISFTFAAANAGRVKVTLTPSRAARDARVLLVSGGVTRCSQDNFALRPDSLSITSGASADPAGASVSNLPRFKAASEPFTMQAASRIGYDGTPTLNANRLQVPAGAKGNLAGTFAKADVADGIAKGAAFTYSEVGYFALGNWGVYDDGGFAAVDSGKAQPECFTDANLGDKVLFPRDPNTPEAGKLGCYFGSVQSAYFGRFIPAHFALSAGKIVNRSALTACVAAPFTYMGEAMTPTFVLTAQNGLNNTTVNYTGTLAKLNIPTQLGLGAVDDPAASTPPVARKPVTPCAVAPPAVPVEPCLDATAPAGTFTKGVSSAIVAPLTVRRPAGAQAPFTAFKVGVAPIDSDGVRIATYNLDTVSVTAGAPNHALVGATIVPFGRLQIDNAYGSELLNLSMRITAQYWNGSGYVTNTLDSCTPMAHDRFSMDGYNKGIDTTNMSLANLVGGANMLNGKGRVLLTRPQPKPTVKGSVVLRSAKGDSLPGSGRATFGVYKAGPVIYMRETY